MLLPKAKRLPRIASNNNSVNDGCNNNHISGKPVWVKDIMNADCVAKFCCTLNLGIILQARRPSITKGGNENSENAPLGKVVVSRSALPHSRIQFFLQATHLK